MLDQVTETTSTASATESTESTASAPATTTTETSAAQQSATPGSTEAAQAYTPNYKFTHLGKEMELDEWARPLITNAEVEKKLKEIYQKAHGVDHFRSGFDKERSAHGETKKVAEKFYAIDKDLKTLGGYLAKEDYDSFFKNINIPNEKIFQWVQKKLQEMGLPPEQQAALKAQQMERERLYHLEQQTQEMQTVMQQQQVQARTYELRSSMSKPEVQQFASRYDSVKGQPGAFEQAVIKYGAFVNRMNGTDLSAEEAIQGVMSEYGSFLSQQPQAAMMQQPASPQGQSTPPPVIPHVAGKGVSPVKAKPRTLDDLRELSRNL